MRLLKNSIVLSVCFVLIISGLSIFINYINVRADVKANRLIYSQELGWISMAHAQVEGTSSFINKCKNTAIKTGDTLTYAQFWGAKIFDRNLFSSR